MINNTETIWHELHTDLGRFIERRVGDSTVADDILQDVFLKIHARSASLKDEQKLVSWAYQITRNAITDYYRSQRTYVELSDDWAEDPDEDDLASDFAPCLRPLVDSLPGKYRDALLLTEFQGLSLQDAADELNLSLSGIKSRVQRARELLRGMLLQCCHFEFDRQGRLIDYYPYCSECATEQLTQTACRANTCASSYSVSQVSY